MIINGVCTPSLLQQATPLRAIERRWVINPFVVANPGAAAEALDKILVKWAHRMSKQEKDCVLNEYFQDLFRMDSHLSHVFNFKDTKNTVLIPEIAATRQALWSPFAGAVLKVFDEYGRYWTAREAGIT